MPIPEPFDLEHAAHQVMDTFTDVDLAYHPTAEQLHELQELVTTLMRGRVADARVMAQRPAADAAVRGALGAMEG